MKLQRFQPVKIILLLGLLLILAGCVPATPEPQTAFDVTLTDSGMQPKKMWVQAGTTTDLHITNTGAAAHSWALLEAFTGAPFVASKQNLVVCKQVVQPGAEVDFQFTAPAMAGEYLIVSTLPGDMEAGLQAKLIVIRP